MKHNFNFMKFQSPIKNVYAKNTQDPIRRYKNDKRGSLQSESGVKGKDSLPLSLLPLVHLYLSLFINHSLSSK